MVGAANLECNWFYIQNPEKSVLIRVNNIFNDYSLMKCDWHHVLRAGWCSTELRKAIGSAYANWTMAMLEREEDELLEDEAKLNAAEMARRHEEAERDCWPQDVMDEVDAMLLAGANARIESD